MVGDLVIHLGGHKTGSTSIQSVLAGRRYDAGGAQIFYPAVLPGTAAEKHRGNHGALAVTLMPKGDPEERARRFGRVAERLRSADAPVAVISAERLEFADPAALADMLEQHLPELRDRTRILVYVRPHAERLVSGYAEQIKQGIFKGTLAELHTRTADLKSPRHFHFHRRFRVWHEVFGDRFHLRPMIRDRLLSGDVVADFLDFALDGQPVTLDTPVERNPSLPLEDLALLRRFHLIASPEGRSPEPVMRFALRLAGQLRDRPVAGTRVRLDRALAETVVAAYADDAAALDQDFCNGTPFTEALQAAPDQAVSAPQSILAEDHFDPAALRILESYASAMATSFARGALDAPEAKM